MNFKRNLTVTFVCFMNEFYISLIPAAFILGLHLKLASIGDLCKLVFFVAPLILVLFNTFLFLLNLIFTIFQKTTIVLDTDGIIVKETNKSSTIQYQEITEIIYNFGEISRTHSSPITLKLLGEGYKPLLTEKNPSLIMTHLIKKKCPTAKITYQNSNRFLYLLGISTVAAFILVVCDCFEVFR